MDFTLLSSIFTVLSMAVFVGILFWAYDRNNKAHFDRMSRLPIDNETGPTGN